MGISIDLNCDMGESYGAWTMGRDAELMDYVSSVSVACGFHAGDPTTIGRTVETALAKNIAIGAHPSYPDLQGFGRREMTMRPAEIYDLVLYQVAALKGVCEASGGRLRHVKPHGALYNRAARDPETAAAIAAAVAAIDPDLVFFGLSGSCLLTEAEKLGLRTASEVFADRSYTASGALTPRGEPHALIESIDDALAQVLEMVCENRVTAYGGAKVAIRAETICIHGDGPRALDFARELRLGLTAKGVNIEPV
jgi:5-oxoprolinase (ATP-hydrolysing) subunit A